MSTHPQRKIIPPRPKPNKLLGQHFLICDWVCDALLRAAELAPEDTVIEVGPGRGALTRVLARHAKRVIAVEKDKVLSQELGATLMREKVVNGEIITGDILRLDFDTLPQSYKIVANIPYYLTARMIRMFLESDRAPELMAITIQKGVAERVIAKTTQMSILALSVQAYGTPEIVATIPASCFSPKPAVDSAILKISNISHDFFTKHNVLPQDFFRIVRLGFSQKRKKLVNNLGQIIPKKDMTALLSDIKHSPDVRAQELSLSDWARLIPTMRNLYSTNQ